MLFRFNGIIIESIILKINQLSYSVRKLFTGLAKAARID